MPFDLEAFYRANQRLLIWLALAALLWLLHDFFGLIFITYVLVVLVLPAARKLHQRTGLAERWSLVAVYLVLLLAVAGFVRFVTPNVVAETNRLVVNLGTMQQRILTTSDHLAERYPSLQGPVLSYLRNSLKPEVREKLEADLNVEAQRLNLPEDAARAPVRWSSDNGVTAATQTLVRFEEERLLGSLLQETADVVRMHAPPLVRLFYHGIVTTLVGLLFSFLILVDLRRLTALVEGIHRSRLRDVYEQAAPALVQLGTSIGVGIRAQAIIAVINMTLTSIGMAILGIPSIAMLAVVVLVCGFVPVVGMFVSTLPILLIALNAGGAQLVLLALVMVLIVHMIESYLLNPLIYGAEFHFNPVLTLIILFAAHHAFGVWGVLLGLPVARYVLRDVLQIPMDSSRRPSST